MPGPAVRVEGAKELSRAFRKATGTTRNLSRAHREVGRLVADRSKDRAASSAPQQRKAAAALLGKGTSREAQLSIRNTGRLPFGIGAFMGALQYRQFPAWVGNSWDIAVAGGPYVIGEAVRANMVEIVDEFERNLGHAIREAGLDARIGSDAVQGYMAALGG
jgi:hypothetical protein